MRLIGRDADLAEVTWLLSAARSGCTGLSVVAAAGMGKTALLDAAAERARSEGFQVLRCAAAEAETDFAYAGLSDLLEPVLAQVRDTLPAPQQRALDIVAHRVDPSGEVVEPQAVARATVTALARAAERAPLLALVDDAHWLDAESRRALAFTARRAEAPLALMVAHRPAVRRPEDALSVALLGMGDERHHELDLKSLRDDEVEQLLLDRGLALPRGVLRRVQRIAGGHPLYAVELARAASADNEVGSFLPASLEHLMRARIDALPRDALHVVAAVAQMSSPTRALVREVMAGEASLSQDGTDAALDVAVEADVLVEPGGELRFTHPLLGEAATLATPVTLRRGVHRRLAGTVTDLTARAVHLSMAHDEADEDVAAVIEAGGAQARARAAPEVAAELLAAALRLTPEHDSASRRRRAVACAYHRVAAGDVRTGLDLLNEALASEPDPESRSDLEWRTAMLHFLSGDLRACVALLESAHGRTQDEQRRQELSVRLASMYVWMGRFRDAATVCARIDPDGLTGVPRLNALGNLMVTRFVAGEPLLLDPLRLIDEFGAIDPAPAPHEHPAGRLVHLLLACGPAGTAAEAVAPALRSALAREDDIGIAWNGAALARALLHAGRWSQAEAVSDEALKAARRAVSTPALVFALMAAALAAAHHGDAERAGVLAAELLNIGARQPYFMCVEQAHLVRGFVALSSGDATDAAGQLSLASEALSEAGLLEPSMPAPRWYLLTALLDAGRIADAETELVGLRAFENRGHALATAMAWTARARLAALRGDRDAAEDAFTRALAAHERLGWPFERAVTVFEQGRVYRHQQRRALARKALTEAAEQFTRLGASLWTERARTQLSAVSGRAPTGPTALTGTERRVAELAAAGLKNREIADSLFISTKTVATHLSHVYAKLQLRSRTELARHLAQARASDH